MQKAMEEEQRNAKILREQGENMQIAMGSTYSAMRAMSEAVKK